MRTGIFRVAPMRPAVTVLSSPPTWAAATPVGWRAAASWCTNVPTTWVTRCWWEGESTLTTSGWWEWAWATASVPAAWYPWYVRYIEIYRNYGVSHMFQNKSIYQALRIFFACMCCAQTCKLLNHFVLYFYLLLFSAVICVKQNNSNIADKVMICPFTAQRAFQDEDLWEG